MLNFHEVIVVLCLTLSYAAAGGLVYCLGLMQSSWVQHLNVTNSDAALINSITLAITLVPAPALQAFRDYFKVPPFLVFGLAAPIMGLGLFFTSRARTFSQLMISNGLGFGLGVLLAITGSLTTVYHFFLDDKVTLATSIVSSGIGVGMIFVAMIFKYVEPTLGWREVCRLQVCLVSVYVLAAIIFFPPVSRLLGIRTRKEKQQKLKKLEKLRKLEEAKKLRENEDAYYGSMNNRESDDICMENNSDNSEVSSPSEDDEEMFPQSLRLIRSITVTQSIRVKTTQLWRLLLKNPKFLLLTVSWLLAEATFNAVMDHQPVRIIDMGYSLQSSADTLAISGAVQIFSRFGVGFLASNNMVSVVRMSQISKIILGVFSIISNLFPSLGFQTVYMFLVGCCGGMLSTTDFILVKDCVTEGRELGITVLLLVDGIFSLIFIAGAGYLYQWMGNYNWVFNIFGICSLVAFALVIVLEIVLKSTNKSNDDRDKSRYSIIEASGEDN